MNSLVQPVFRTVRVVLFDLDGTLIDSAPDMGAATNRMRTDRGLPALALESYRHRAGSGARGMLDVAFGMASDHPDYAASKEEFFLNYDQCLTERTRAIEGVEELLRTLVARGLQWGVVTNKSSRYTVPLARAFALLASAGTIISGDTTAHTKPHPAPLLEAARRLAVDPADCLYVGDDERDVIAGRAAGMGTVAASYGYLGVSTDTKSWGADAVIDSPLGLLQCLPKA
ncbi:MAG: HAD-IA family hydrolase [Burkholderiaceae bacterium]